jgi:FkbM family methyltransferase
MFEKIHSFLKDHVTIWLIHKYYGLTYYPFNTKEVLLGFSVIDKIIMKDGSIFMATENSQDSISQSYEDYHFSDISPDDVILDIGANVGGVSIQLAKKGKMVYSVEPIFTDELNENIKLNNLTNINVLPFALGEKKGSEISLQFAKGKKDRVQVASFKEIINICGGHIDFLKCDCEGGELFIPFEELIKIPKIEMELHDFKNEKSQALYKFLNSNWNCESEMVCTDPALRIIHARRQK